MVIVLVVVEVDVDLAIPVLCYACIVLYWCYFQRLLSFLQR